MEDVYIGNVLQGESYTDSNFIFGFDNYSYNPFNIYNYSNFSLNFEDGDQYIKKIDFIFYVVNCVIICIGFPLTLVAIYALYSLVEKDHVAPIYVINLLISDLIQFCCMSVEMSGYEDMRETGFLFYTYFFSVAASVGFMVCVALERYLVIAWPLWYRFRRTIKTSVVVCVVAWVLPFVYLIPVYFSINYVITDAIFGVVLLLPLPLFIFFLVGTLKALSASISVPSDEKRRILGVLVLVMLIYILLFLPNTIVLLVDGIGHTVLQVCLMCLRLSPLTDLVLYIFMRKGTIDKLLASLCCSTAQKNDTVTSSV